MNAILLFSTFPITLLSPWQLSAGGWPKIKGQVVKKASKRAPSLRQAQASRDQKPVNQ